MKKHLLLTFTVLFSIAASAQVVETYKKKGYILNFSTNDTTVSKALQQRLISTFFTVYPKLAKEYNKETDKTVYIMLDTTYNGVAATGNAHVRISPKYMKGHPEDIDVVTHEVMHIVQNYGRSVGPGWLTEGIADYARNQFGLNNPAAKWSIAEYKPGQKYNGSYRTTARFLVWVEKKYKKGIVKELDKQLRDHTYTAKIWEDQTGKTLEALGAEYETNPSMD